MLANILNRVAGPLRLTHLRGIEGLTSSAEDYRSTLRKECSESIPQIELARQPVKPGTNGVQWDGPQPADAFYEKMRRTLLFTLSLAGFISFLPAPAKAQWAMTCTRDPNSSVNLRRGPGLNHGIIASIPNQSTVRVMSWVWGADNMRWYRLESSGIVGFARSDYLCK